MELWECITAVVIYFSLDSNRTCHISSQAVGFSKAHLVDEGRPSENAKNRSLSENEDSSVYKDGLSNPLEKISTSNNSLANFKNLFAFLWSAELNSCSSTIKQQAL
ncbi:uncharacterized protein METZ01_LOCUS321626, partial [marine metagenome]